MGDRFRVPDLGDIAEFLKLTEGSCRTFGLKTEACYIKRVQSAEVALQKAKPKGVYTPGV